jgi:cysteine desulfurase
MSANMAPSHVLAAMGLPTTGNIRLTLHPQTTEDEIDYLLNNLKELVIRQRS